MRTTLFVIIIVAALCSTMTAGAVSGGEETRYESCLAMCQAAETEICEPAVVAAANGKIPQERVAPICRCGVLVCANTCADEVGSPPRSLPQECIELGVY